VSADRGHRRRKRLRRCVGGRVPRDAHADQLDDSVSGQRRPSCRRRRPAAERLPGQFRRQPMHIHNASSV